MFSRFGEYSAECLIDNMQDALVDLTTGNGGNVSIRVVIAYWLLNAKCFPEKSSSLAEQVCH